MMDLVNTFLLVSGSCTLAAGAFVTRMVLFYKADIGAEAPGYSLDRYQVLTRLSSEEDLRFLQSLPGFSPAMARQWHSERRRLLRMYLKEMSGDFHALHKAARRLIAVAPAEQHELVGVLMKQQMRFWRSLAAVEMRLTLQWTGLTGVDLRGLLESLDALHNALSQANVAQAGATA